MVIPRILEPEVMDSHKEAVDYDSMNHDSVNRVFVDDLIQFVESKSKSKLPDVLNVIDVGTGTAQIPLVLADCWDRTISIAAVDLSIEMLRLARRNVSNSGTAVSITPVFCDAKRLPVCSSSIEVVMSNSIVHHIPEPIAVMREMTRVVSPGGFLFVRDLMRPDSINQIDWLVSEYAGDENAHQQQMFRDSLHAALTLDEVRQVLEECRLNPDSAAASSDRHWTVACCNL